jgi:hypothetical protein
MTDETTRIPVPTNGHAPLPAHPESSTPEARGPDRPSLPPGVAAGTDLRRAVVLEVRPMQLATGLAVVAGLIALVLGARRRRGR